jgi:hypothetical protein
MAVLKYTFSASTAAGIGTNGSLRFDDTTIADVTSLYINEKDNTGLSNGSVLATFGATGTPPDYGKVYITDGTNIILFELSGPAVNNTTYYTVPVTYVSGTLPVAGAILQVKYVSTVDAIAVEDFNAIAIKVGAVLGQGSGSRGYGQTVRSAPLAQNSNISSLQWNNLRSDMVKARQHQIGITIGSGTGNTGQDLAVISSGIEVSDEILAQYQSFADFLDQDRLDADPTELQSELLAVATQNLAWNGTLTHTVTITGSTLGDGSAQNLRYFFNAGGKLLIDVSRTGNDERPKNDAWNAMYDATGVISINYSDTTYANVSDPNVTVYGLGWEDLTTSNQLFLKTEDPTGFYPGNRFEVYARKSADNTQVILTISAIDDYVMPVGGLPDENNTGILTSKISQLRPISTNVTVNPLTSAQTITAGAAVEPTFQLFVYKPLTITASSSSDHTFTCSSTANMVENGPIEFTGTVFGGVLLATTYYVHSIVSETKFKISDTQGGSVKTLTTASGSMTGKAYGIVEMDEGSTIIAEVNTTNLENGTALYWTPLGTVSNADFSTGYTSSVINNQCSFTITTNADVTTEGNENFRIQVRTGSISGRIVATSSPIVINDTSLTPATYDLRVSGSLGGPILTSMNEGSTAIFEVTTTQVLAGTTLYWTVIPVSGTIEAADFVDSTLTGTVVIDTLGKGTFSRTLSRDLSSEGTEIFRVNLYAEDPNVNPSAQVKAYSTNVTVVDTSLTPPTYAVVADIVSVNEGGTVNFNVTTTNFGSGTLYWTVLGTAGADDFTDQSASGNVSITNNTGTFTRQLLTDLKTEGTETFTVQLRTGSVSGPVVATSQEITVVDTSKNLPNYISVTPNVTVVNEGATVTFNVLTAFVADQTPLYWRVEATGNINDKTPLAGDFSDDTLTGTVNVIGDKASIVRAIKADGTTEGVERFVLKIYTSPTYSIGSLVLSSTIVSIVDSSVNDPFYSIAASATSFNESTSTITFNVVTQYVPEGNLYWKIRSVQGSVDKADFVENVDSGEVLIEYTNAPTYEGAGSFQLTVRPDSLTEGVEKFVIELTASALSKTVLATSQEVTVNDTSLSSPTYQIVPSATTVNEGDVITFTVNTTNLTIPTTFYWKITAATGTVDANDFSSAISGSVLVSNNKGTINLTTFKDYIQEGSESFFLNLLAAPTDTISLATSPEIFITDSTTTLIANPTTVSEGSSITFDITTTGVADRTIFYWTLGGMVDIADFGLQEPAGEVEILGNKGKVTLAVVSDLRTEGTETFFLQVRRDSRTGPILRTSSLVSIIDTSVYPEVVVVSLDKGTGADGTISVNEGDTIVATVTTTNVPAGRVYYWDVVGTTIANDFSPSVLSGSITINGSGTATFSVPILNDLIEEGQEHFYINLRPVQNGGIIYTSPKINVADTSAVTITANKSVIREGEVVRFTVRTTNFATTPTLYWTTIGTTADADFTDNTLTGTFTFTSTNIFYIDRTAVVDGGSAEGTENFAIQIRTGSHSGPVIATSEYVSIRDVGYSVVPSALTIKEGETVNFDVFTTNVPDNTTFNWEITGTAIGSDFTETALTGTVKVVGDQGRVTKIASINNAVEGDKTFKLILKDSSNNPLAESAEVTLRDISFTLTPSATTIAEGQTLTVAVTTTNVADGTVYYWDITDASTGLVNYDFTTATSGSVTIQSNSAVTPITLTIRDELLTEGAETFKVRLKATASATTGITSTNTITITDAFTCAITHNAVGNAVDEGNAVTFTVTTTGLAASPATTLYWKVVGTTDNILPGDFSATQGTVSVSNNTGTFSVTVTADNLTEPTTEKFKVELRRNESDVQIIGQSVEITINDTSQSASSYSVVGTPNPVTEGNVLTFNITATNVANGTVLNWDIEPFNSLYPGGDINDVVGGLSGNVTINGGTGTVLKTISNDAQLEGTEQINFRLKNLANSVLANTVVTILDTSSIVVSPTTPITVAEGSSFNCTVNATNLANTQLYWTVIGANVDSSDFRNGINSGSFWANSGMGTFTINMANDLLVENDETFRVQIRTGSTSGTVFANSAVITIKDVVATVTPSTLTVKEGANVRFDISATNITTGANLIWEIRGHNGSSITSSDFTDGILTGNVTISNSTGVVNKTIAYDLSSEGTEQFVMDIKTQDGFVLVTSSPVSITDVTYSITPSTLTVKEGESVDFEIATSGVSIGTSVYWRLVPTLGTVNGADFSDGAIEGTFTLSSSTYTLTRSIVRDLTAQNVEGDERFKIELYTAKGGTLLAESSQVTITDVVYALTFDTSSSGTSTIKEGEWIRYNVALAGVNNGTTIYWRLRATTGTLATSDFTQTSGSFVTTGSDKLTITSSYDKTTSPLEGAEVYVVELFTDSGFTNKVATGPSFTLSDVTVVITPSVTSISENDTTPIVFNLALGNISNTNLYWAVRSITGNSVDSNDFTGPVSGTIAVTTNTTASFSLQMKVDSNSEGLEQFVVDVRLVDPSTGPVIATSPVISITDLAVSIIADKNLVREGENVKFTVNSSSNPTSTYFWSVRSTGANAVTSADFSSSMTGSITLVAGTGSFTLTPVVDTATNEVDNKFVVDLFNSSGGTLLVSSQEVTIGDVTVSSVASATTILEGDEVVFDITTTNLPSPTTLFWVANGGNITGSDFTDGKLSGSITVNNNIGTFSRRAALDNSNSETSETFTVSFYLGSATGTLLHTTEAVTILNRWLTITPSSTTVSEGGTLTFTLASQNIPNGTVVDWSVRGISTGITSADFGNGSTGNVQINSNAATFNLPIASDYSFEGTETFVVDATTTIAGTVINASTGTISITDVNYTITSNKTAIKENESVTFTVTTGTSVSSVYWKLRSVSGTVDGNDFAGAVEGTLNLTSGSGTITLTSIYDSSRENTESFVIDLYTSNPAGSGTLITLNAPCPTVTISDVNVVADPISAITVAEGEPLNVKFNTFGLTAGTTLYWEVVPTSGTVNGSDFVPNTLAGTFTVASDLTCTWTKQIAFDNQSDNNDKFRVDVRIGSASGTVIGSSPEVTMTDRSFSVTPSSATTVNEGDTVTFQISAANCDGLGYNWSLVKTGSTSSTLNLVDHVTGAVSGSGTFSGNSATVNVPVQFKADSINEGDMQVQLAVTVKNTQGTTVSPTVNSGVITVKNKSILIQTNKTAIAENESVTFTVTADTTLASVYWKVRTVSGTVNSGDFSTAIEGTLSLTNGTGAFTLTSAYDSSRENTESFVIDLYTSNPAGSGTLIPLSAPCPTVTISDVNVVEKQPVPTTVAEGDSFTLTFDTFGIAAGTTLYWKIEPTFGSLDKFDYVIEGLEGTFNVTTSSTVALTRQIKFDNDLEGNERFRVDVRIGSASGTVIGSSSDITIADRSIAITPNTATTVNEGDTVTFQLTATNCNATTYSWSLIKTGSTDASLNLTEHVTGAISGSGTFSGTPATVNIPITFKTDTVIEGDMQVQLRVTANNAQSVVMLPELTSGVITVKDTTIIVEPATVPSIKEGNSATITVRNSYASSWYWESTNTTDVTPTSGTLNFTNKAASFTLTALNDSLIEGSETLAVNLYTSQGGTLIRSITPITILDVTCAITPSVNTIYEGQTISFGIQTSNIDTSTPLYWYITGTTSGADLFDGVMAGTFNVNSSGAFTLTKVIATDLDTEVDETLYLNVKLNNASGTLIGTSPLVTVKNREIKVTSYTATAKEGETATYNLATTNIPNGTTVNWVITPGTTTLNSADFSPATLSGTTVVNSNAASVTVNLAYDNQVEIPEVYRFVASATVDGITYSTPPSFAVTSIQDVSMLVGSPTSVREGQSITFGLTTTNIPSGTTVYYTVRPTTGAGTVTPATLGLSSLKGTLVTSGTSGSLTFSLPYDWVKAAGDRKFVVDFRLGSDSNPVVATSAEVTILDVHVTIATDKDVYNEGETVNVTITTSNVPNATEYYWRILPDGAYAAPTIDDIAGNVLSGKIAINNQTFTGTLALVNDIVGDDTTYDTRLESFKIQLYLDAAMTVPITSAFTSTKTIVDTSYTTVTPSVDFVSEGSSVVFTVNVYGSPAYSGTLYWSTSTGVDKDDFGDKNINGEVSIVNGLGTITRTIAADRTTEGGENFFIYIRKNNITGPIIAVSSTVIISDTSITIYRGQGTSVSPTGQEFTLTTEAVNIAFNLVGAGGGAGSQDGGWFGGNGGAGGTWYAMAKLPATANTKRIRMKVGQGGGGGKTGREYVHAGVPVAGGYNIGGRGGAPGDTSGASSGGGGAGGGSTSVEYSTDNGLTWQPMLIAPGGGGGGGAGNSARIALDLNKNGNYTDANSALQNTLTLIQAGQEGDGQQNIVARYPILGSSIYDGGGGGGGGGAGGLGGKVEVIQTSSVDKDGNPVPGIYIVAPEEAGTGGLMGYHYFNNAISWETSRIKPVAGRSTGRIPAMGTTYGVGALANNSNDQNAGVSGVATFAWTTDLTEIPAPPAV